MLFLLGKSVFDARNFINKHGLDPREVRVVYSKYSLYGNRNVDLCILDSAQERSDIQEFEEELRYRLALGDMTVIGQSAAAKKYGTGEDV